MIATMRYEFHMQLRSRAMWVVYALVFTVYVAVDRSFFTLYLGRGVEGEPKTAMLALGTMVGALMPVAYGCMVADRLVRDTRLGVAGVLDTTPTGQGSRLIGKYLGVCAATAAPIALVFFGRAIVFAVAEGEPTALGWASTTFLLTITPGLIFIGALTLTGPLLISPMIFRVLFVVYWFWGNLIYPAMMPTISGSIFDATGGYMEFGLLSPERDPNVIPYGPYPGAALNFLRPVASPTVAFLWLGTMLALAVAVLALARLHLARKAT
ncbi:hypothetical protein [Rhizohabitans arisaemae]|uniref:hypothetical protein n=1 Tax=Rhizohabitans arisaemae TaxID=2720610 RepID=UPI0024B20774|nr:hypothetical protein [Rhizohabitans arisaemae]